MATGNFICNGCYLCWSCWRRVNLVAHCQQHCSTNEHCSIYNCSPLHHVLPRMTAVCKARSGYCHRRSEFWYSYDSVNGNKPFLCIRSVTVCSFKFARLSLVSSKSTAEAFSLKACHDNAAALHEIPVLVFIKQAIHRKKYTMINTDNSQISADVDNLVARYAYVHNCSI